MNKKHFLSVSLIAFFWLISSRLTPQDKIPSQSIAAPYHNALFPALLQSGFTNWDNGYLLAYSPYPLTPVKSGIVLYSKTGEVAREATVWFDDARSVSLSAAAVSKSGKLVVSGGTTNQQGVIANFIAEIGPDNHIARVIRTSPFLPAYICAVDDGDVWSLGVDRDEHLASIPDSFRLREFAFGKGQLKAFLDTSKMDTNWALLQGRYPGEVSLRCSPKKVVVYHAATGDLAEFDLKSNSFQLTKVSGIQSAPAQSHVTGFALTDSGDLFASVLDMSQKPFTSSLFKLRRDEPGRATWIPVVGVAGPYLHGSPIERLLGTEGDDLVYTNAKDGRAYWSRQTGQ
jgi:hypothetical protein